MALSQRMVAPAAGVLFYYEKAYYRVSAWLADAVSSRRAYDTRRLIFCDRLYATHVYGAHVNNPNDLGCFAPITDIWLQPGDALSDHARNALLRASQRLIGTEVTILIHPPDDTTPVASPAYRATAARVAAATKRRQRIRELRRGEPKVD